jgi:hypothetical protein
VPPGPPGNHPGNLPTTSSSTPRPQPSSGTSWRHPINLPTKRFQPAAEPRKIDLGRIADLPPLPVLSYDEYDATEDSDDLSDLGGAERKPPSACRKRSSP